MPITALELGGARASLQSFHRFHHGPAVLRMHQFKAGGRFQVLLGVAENHFPRRIELQQPALEVRDAEHVQSQGEEPVSSCLGFQAISHLGHLALVPGFLQAPQLFPLEFHQLCLSMQLNEDRNLGPQDLWNDGGQQVIDRPERITARDMVFRIADRGHKNDRRMFGTRPLADERCRFEAVHRRHRNIQEDHRKILF